MIARNKQRLPPCTVISIKKSIEKASHSYDCCEKEHLSVIAQPSKIDPNLLSIIFPEKKKTEMNFSKCSPLQPQYYIITVAQDTL